jgi:hypothetical protein
METQRTNVDSPGDKNVTADRTPKMSAPGATPAGVGEAAGRTKGAAIGDAIGHAFGVGADAVVGAVEGGIAVGKNTAGKIGGLARQGDEHEYWRNAFTNRPYYTRGTPYEQYGPAFQYGWESYAKHNQWVKTFEDVEPQLARDWESRRQQSKLSWTHAKCAVRDAWHRAEEAACGAYCN